MSSQSVQLDYAASHHPQRRPLAELLFLAGPTIAQMASYTVMQFADAWMLSVLGTAEPAAAGNAGIFSFSVIGLGFGVLLCVNTLVSQHYGQKDYARCGSYLWQGIWFGLGYSLLAAGVLPFTAAMFRSFGHPAGLVAMETAYFQILVATAAIKMTATTLGQFLLAINRPWIVLGAAVAAMVSNIFFNWLLIYGNWGFPRLEVAGAAWGTAIAVFVEMTILAIAAVGGPTRRSFNSLDWRPRWRQLRTLLAVGIPSGAQVVCDVLAWGLFSVWVMARFETEAMAANTFIFRYLSVSFMPAFGVSTAVTALVGRYIGAGRPDLAQRRAHLGFYVTAAYMVSCGALYILGRNQLMHLFSEDPLVLKYGATLLIFAGVYQIFDAMYIVYNGALRGAGDTLLPAVATAILCWGVTVLGGYVIAVTWPGLGPAGPWLAATAYGVILGFWILGRFLRGRWRSINLDAGLSSDTLRGFPVLPPVRPPDAAEGK